MWAKIAVAVAAALVLGSGLSASAAEKPGRPLNIKPPITKQPIAKQGDAGWRERAMKARAEFAPDGKPPVYGNARATDERGDRNDGEDAGSGSLRQDRGEGGGE